MDEYRFYVRKKIDLLVPVLAHSAVGDYSVDVPVEEVDDDEFGEVFAGIQFMLEAIREQTALLQKYETSTEVASA